MQALRDALSSSGLSPTLVDGWRCHVRYGGGYLFHSPDGMSFRSHVNVVRHFAPALPSDVDGGDEHRRTHVARGAAATSYRSLRHDAKLVNRRVSVYWDGEDMWYSGTVREFDVVDDSHVVQYDDGDVQR